MILGAAGHKPRYPLANWTPSETLLGSSWKSPYRCGHIRGTRTRPLYISRTLAEPYRTSYD